VGNMRGSGFGTRSATVPSGMFQGEGRKPTFFTSRGCRVSIPVTCDDALKAAMNAVITNLSGLTTLRLFQNNFQPLPNVILADFLECTFAGYSAIIVGGVWTGPTNPASGIWQFDSGILAFTCTAGSQVVYGWYLKRGAHFIEACQLFDNPVTMTAGLQLQLELRPQGITQFVV